MYIFLCIYFLYQDLANVSERIIRLLLLGSREICQKGLFGCYYQDLTKCVRKDYYQDLTKCIRKDYLIVIIRISRNVSERIIRLLLLGSHEICQKELFDCHYQDLTKCVRKNYLIVIIRISRNVSERIIIRWVLLGSHEMCQKGLLLGGYYQDLTKCVRKDYCSGMGDGDYT